MGPQAGRPIVYPLKPPVQGFIATTVAFSRDGKSLFGASQAGSAVRWGLADPSSTRQTSADLSNVKVVDMDMSPNGKLIATATEDGKVDVRNFDTGYNLVLAGHDSLADNVKFSTDGTRLVTSSTDGTARVWNVSGSEAFAPRGVRSSKTGGRTAISADGRVVAVSRGDNAVFVVPYTDPTSPREAPRPPERQRGRGAGSVAGREHHRGSDVPGERHRVGQVSFVRSFFNVGTPTQVLAVSRDGTSLAVGRGDSGSGIVYDLAAGVVTQKIDMTSCVSALTYSNDGKHLAVGQCEGPITIIDLGKHHKTVLKGHASRVDILRFRSDGRQLASVAVDGTIRLWNLADATREVLRDISATVRGVAYVAGGTQLLTVANQGSIDMWDIASAHPVPVYVDEILVDDTTQASNQ